MENIIKNKEYRCDICNETFVSNYHLKKHQRGKLHKVRSIEQDLQLNGYERLNEHIFAVKRYINIFNKATLSFSKKCFTVFDILNEDEKNDVKEAETKLVKKAFYTDFRSSAITFFVTKKELWIKKDKKDELLQRFENFIKQKRKEQKKIKEQSYREYNEKKKEAISLISSKLDKLSESDVDSLIENALLMCYDKNKDKYNFLDFEIINKKTLFDLVIQGIKIKQNNTHELAFYVIDKDQKRFVRTIYKSEKEREIEELIFSNEVLEAVKSNKNVLRQGDLYLIKVDDKNEIEEIENSENKKENAEISQFRRHVAEKMIIVNGNVFVRGKITHPEHECIVLESWYKVANTKIID